MNLKLEGKRAFISGSTQGIGFAIAKQLLNEKAEVIINGRNEEKTNLSVQKLKDEFPQAIISGIVCDFGNKEEVNELLNQLNGIDILINNVGVFELKDFESIEDEDWHRIFDINVMSSIKLSKKLLPQMLQKKSGRIIFISSESGVNIPANMIHYGMTKAAMMAVSNGLSKLTLGTEITVNTILGGPTYSDGVASTIEHIASLQNIEIEQMKSVIIQQTNPHSLLQRFIDPTEIASLVAYLSSPLSIATNGACLRADGGTLKTI
ncbi:NAD(P)-dependent dehydrogenase, short-chain alcohol dehydrogenase family [Flavobacterium resistens]|uniref:NAD(P)-dependent dehydrogenase, short-chain alcohol dehydrogenase family n=1 Tax=Flavobacterium resistens TaxID=443612 RepID=A0A521AND2_9FLAO|nr:SDR family oxidoreductase [Flavobacterium resistens]MRX69818.1 SDR family NAD(P)-dependent oxidoreductase [Flavobacterium resistens]SMO36305.1 NAD(P)-dependent dehydrogenase, short-chain alcohol dehydrogenase family [Flavobacterium resistens]